ncbi:MAG TPA: energy transducer TonB, partial [Myxococcaceae bacterium]|nr:energy transducer TonB [Myxococcaceae bacterium]
MFDSVLNRAQNAKGRFGTGTFISIALHGGLLVGALWISSAPSKPEVKEQPLTMVTLVKPKGNPGP